MAQVKLPSVVLKRIHEQDDEKRKQDEGRWNAKEDFEKRVQIFCETILAPVMNDDNTEYPIILSTLESGLWFFSEENQYRYRDLLHDFLLACSSGDDVNRYKLEYISKTGWVVTIVPRTH